MIRADNHLRPDWVRRQCELALPTFPAGARISVRIGEKRLADIGEHGDALVEDGDETRAIDLDIDGDPVGSLFYRLPPGADDAQAHRAAQSLAHSLRGMLNAEHGRRSVAREALDSYREIALIQRAITDLNRSLRPGTVAAALLKEFETRADTAGAVFLRDDESDRHTVAGSFGADANETFIRLSGTPQFAEIANRETGDIVDDLDDSPWAKVETGFRSLLWLPLVAHDERLGILMVASSRAGGFSAADLKRAQTLASVATSALRNARMFAAEQQMFQSFVRVIATAIDAKSPYTAGHCRRVPELTLMLAEAAHREQDGMFSEFSLDDDMRNGIEIAAMLHDCGKVVTPEWVVDKAAKLERIVDRIELVALRFELLRRDALEASHRALAEGTSRERAESACRERLAALDDDFSFIERCNRGGEFLSDDDIARIRAIAARPWRDGRGESRPLLTDDEVANLVVRRGTLNPEERGIIESHAVHTINMLSKIAFPRALRHVAEYAAGHHERVDGKGYPRGLTREQLPLPARMIAIADIFEALTAPDRPYRKPGKLSWAIDTMHRMRLDGHIDPDLFDLFLGAGIHTAYAARQLAPEQVDDVDIARYLGGGNEASC